MDISMNLKDRHFRGQGPNEVVLAFCRKHWITLIYKMAVFFFIVILTIVFIFNYQILKAVFSEGMYQVLILLIGMLLLYYIHHFFLVLIEHYLSIVIITSQRVVAINKSVFFVNEKETVDLLNIQDVHKSQSGFMQNLFNFGDLRIQLAMSATGVVLKQIPNPDFHFRLINKARQAYLEERRAAAASGTVASEGVGSTPSSGPPGSPISASLPAPAQNVRARLGSFIRKAAGTNNGVGEDEIAEGMKTMQRAREELKEEKGFLYRFLLGNKKDKTSKEGENKNQMEEKREIR